MQGQSAGRLIFISLVKSKVQFWTDYINNRNTAQALLLLFYYGARKVAWIEMDYMYRFQCYV